MQAYESVAASMAHGPIQALGYLGLRSNNLDDWPAFAGGVLGMQVISDGPDRMRLRMDEKAQRYFISRSDAPALDFVGFEVASAADLATMRDGLRHKGLDVRTGEPGELADRRGDGMVHQRNFPIAPAVSTTRFE